jgi:hypothetical protein
MAKRLDNFYIARAIRNMAQYYNLTTPRDVSANIAFQQIQGFTGVYPNEELAPDPIVTTLIDLMVNTSTGALPVKDSSNKNQDLISYLTTFSSRAGQARTINNDDALQRFRSMFTIYTGADLHGESNFATQAVQEMLGVARGQDHQYLNGLNVIQINTPKILPSSKYAEACSLFLNGYPTIEMARAVPLINVKFLFGRNSLDDNQRLNATSIFKFLEGAIRVANDNALGLMVKANELSGSIAGAQNSSGYLSTAGMELFTSPLTMVNANTANPTYGETNYNNELRTVPVLDKFRPFMSFKGLTINVQPSGFALISFKTAKMEFVLHDRSRMHEIADFIKPDLYGSTEIMIEYGWSHPDPASVNNPYADLLNASRVEEKYGIRNSSFVYDDSGQVNITLDLFTKGADDIQSYIVATASGQTQRSLERIQQLSEVIRTLRARFQTNNANNASGGSSRGSREVRGIQILDAAGDNQNGIRLTRSIVDQLAQFRRSTATITGPTVDRLNQSLRELYETETNPSAQRRTQGRASTANRGEVGRLAVNIQREIQSKLQRLKTSHDPFLPRGIQLPDRSGNLAPVNSFTDPRFSRGNQSLASRPRRNDEEVRERRRRTSSSGQGTPSRPTRRTRTGEVAAREYTQLDEAQLNEFQNVYFSLGKILTLFVGDTLASTGNYEDVQLIFYPFNPYAGYANGLNISEFVVDGRFFIEQFVKFRTESPSRAANLNLKEFMEFIANRIIDDPVASVYGIDSLYYSTIDRNTNERSYEVAYEAAEFQARLERRLLQRTPDGTFKMPQISIKLEACPVRKIAEASSSPTGLAEALEEPDFSKTILRVHIFDRQCSQFEGQTSIVGAAREESLSSISQVPAVAEGEEFILNEYRGLISTIIERGRAAGIIEEIPRERLLDRNFPVYRVIGGPQKIKNFIMKTMPYVIYGAQGSNVKTAQFQSMTSPELSTVNMIRTIRGSPLRSNGEQPGGLPLTVIPSEMNMSIAGFPLIDFGQQFFVDFQTGTNIDNVYVITGLTHKISQGVFETDIKFTPSDAFGKYESFLSRINHFSAHLGDIVASTNSSSPSSANSSGNTNPAPRNR